ncbi:helix-turn-helix domain-containing protein [Streptomyces scabiei]|uniref:helix-turn-helix domain-containing protein n=1 Tax=Streptomyces scabiei TaxID=1930 RepID=UPI0034049DCA
MIRHQRAVQEALFICAQRPATTRSGLPFDAHLSRSKRQQLLTQTELSQMIGASRNAVVNALKPWREQDWVCTTSGGGLLVRDIHSIRSHARTQA